MTQDDPKTILENISFGESLCKSILIDGYGMRVTIHILNMAFRGPNPGRWGFDQGKNIDDGKIVISGVTRIEFSPPGLIPNDSIENIRAELAPTSLGIEHSEEKWVFTALMASMKTDMTGDMVTLKIVGDSVSIEDLAKDKP